MSDHEEHRSALVEAAADAAGNAFAAFVETLDRHGFAIYRKKRRMQERRATTAAPITDELREKILATFHSTDLTQREIAVLYNVNPGRVNEVVNGRNR